VADEPTKFPDADRTAFCVGWLKHGVPILQFRIFYTVNNMSEPTLNREVALRIALAARAIPDMSIHRMLDILQDSIAGPLTLKSLKGITVSQLQMAIAGTDHEPNANLINVDTENLKRAVQALWGEQDECSMPQAIDNSVPLLGAIRIAVASNDGEMLNGHFGSCVRFLVYDLNASEIRLVDLRTTLAADGAEDKNEARAGLIADCAILYLLSIGGPAAAKVVRSGIYPIKEKLPLPARDALVKLQSVMANSPPPWLAKIIGQSPEARVRFTLEDDVA
jgi:nitrogen fixation protein NifX